MDIENKPTRLLDPLDRARQVSQALAQAARRARLSRRSRGNYAGGGFHARRGALLIRRAMIWSMILLVILPGTLGFVYFGLLASDQYVAEAKFSVAGGITPQLDSLGAVTGLAAASIVQDTQIVVNYLGSRAAIEAISNKIDLKHAYGRDDIDYMARFDSGKPIEKFERYWQSMATASITLPAGIVNLKVRAFTPQEAFDIANAVLGVSEGLVNDMNNRMNADAVRYSEAELARATERLTKARVDLERARNDVSTLDANKAADAIAKLVTDTRGSLLAMQQEYATKQAFVSANSPQMQVLRERIETTMRQIAELEAQLTSSRSPKPGETATIAATMTRFAQLDLEKQIAEKLYGGAVASVEVARLAAAQKKIYLNAFVRPALPQEAQYPRRVIYPLLLAVVLLAAWGSAWGLISAVRNHMA